METAIQAIISIAETGVDPRSIATLADVLRAQNEYERRYAKRLPDGHSYSRDAVYAFLLELALRAEPTFRLKYEAWKRAREPDLHQHAHGRRRSISQTLSRSPVNGTVHVVGVTVGYGDHAALQTAPSAHRSVDAQSSTGAGAVSNVSAEMKHASESSSPATKQSNTNGATHSTTQRRMSIIREWAVQSGSPAVSLETGTLYPGFDTQRYEDFKRMGRAFRRWATCAAVLRSERRRAMSPTRSIPPPRRDVALMARTFYGLRDACRQSRLDRQQLVTALEHWATVTMRKVLHAWAEDAFSSLGPMSDALTHCPVAVKTLFRWVTITLQARPTRTGSRQPAGSPSSKAWNRASSPAGRARSPAPPGGAHSGAGAWPLAVADLDGGEWDGMDPAQGGQGSTSASSMLPYYVMSRVHLPHQRLPLLARATAAADAHTLLTVFSAWKARAEQYAAVKHRCGQLRLQRQVRAWKGYAHMSKVTKRAIGRLRSAHMTRCFNTWASYAQYRRQKAVLVARADAMQAKLARKHVFAALVALLPICRRLRLVTAFATWKAKAVQLRKLRKIAMFVRNDVLAMAFRRMKQIPALAAQECQEADALCATVCARRALAAWRVALLVKGKMKQVAFKWRYKAVTAAFRGWKAYHEEKQAQKLTMMKVANRIRNKGISRALATWRERATTRRANKELAKRVLTVLTHQKVAQALHSWQEYTEEKRRAKGIMRSVLARLINLRLGQCVRTWQHHTAELRWQKYVKTTVIVRMQHVQLGAAVRTWHGRLLEKKREREIMRICLARFMNVKLAQSVRSWREYSQQKMYERALMHRVVQNLRNLSLANAIRTWRGKRAERAKNKAIIAAVAHRMQHRHVAAAFNSLVENARYYSALMEHAAALDQDRLEGKARRFLQHLKDTSRAASRKKETLSRAVAFMRNGTLSRAFNAWRDYQNGKVQWSAQLAEAARCIINRQALFALRAWRQKAHMRAYHRSVLSQTMHRITHRALYAAMAGWKDAVTGRKARQAIAEERYWGKANETLRGCMQALRQFKDAAQSARSHLSRMEHIFSRRVVLRQAVQGWSARAREATRAEGERERAEEAYRGTLLRKTYARWATYTYERKELRARANAVAIRWAQSVARWAVERWQSKVAARNKARALDKHAGTHAAGAAVRRWTAWAQERRARTLRSARIASMLQSHYEYALLLRTWAAWARYRAWRAHLARKGKELLARTDSRKAHNALAVWSQAWRVSVFMKALRRKRSRAALHALQAYALGRQQKVQLYSQADVHHLRTITSRAVRTWLHDTRLKLAEESVIRSHRVHTLSRAVRRLRDGCRREAQLTRLQNETATAHFFLRRGASAVKKWLARSQASMRRQRADALQRSLLVRRIVSALRAWRAQVHRTRLGEIQAARAIQQKREALRAWRRSARAVSVAVKYAEWARVSRVKEGLTSWRTWVQSRKAARAQALAAKAQYRHRALQNVFHAWSSMTASIKQHRAEVAAQQELRIHLEVRYERTRLATLKVVFSTWQQRVYVTQRCRAIAAAFCLESIARPAFSAWAAYSRHQKQVRHMLAAFLEGKRTAMLRAVVGHLREQALEARAVRAHRQALLNRAFTSWRMCSATSAVSRTHSLRLALHAHEVRVRRKIVQAWGRWAAHRAKLHELTGELLQRRAARAARSALRHWSLHARAHAHALMVQAKATKLHQRRLLIRVFSAWAAQGYRPGRDTVGMLGHKPSFHDGHQAGVDVLTAAVQGELGQAQAQGGTRSTRRLSYGAAGTPGKQDFDALQWALGLRASLSSPSPAKVPSSALVYHPATRSRTSSLTSDDRDLPLHRPAHRPSLGSRAGPLLTAAPTSAQQPRRSPSPGLVRKPGGGQGIASAGSRVQQLQVRRGDV